MTDGETSSLPTSVEVTSDELSLREAHLTMGLSQEALRHGIANGRLEARNVGRSVPRWRINRESLETFEASISGYSISEVERLRGISHEALRAAIADGRLEARYTRRDHLRPGTQGDRWRISQEALDRFVASCPTCAWPGCERPGVTAAGRCSREHGGATPEQLHSPEAQAKSGATRRGVPRPRTPESIERGTEGVRRFFADPERSQAWRRRLSELRTRDWETGEGAARAVVATMRGATRQRWLGRWAARQVGRAGGRQRGYTDLQARGVLELKRENPTFGYRRLAEECELTEWQVRAILAEAGQS